MDGLMTGLLHLTFEGYKKSADYTNGHGMVIVSFLEICSLSGRFDGLSPF